MNKLYKTAYMFFIWAAFTLCGCAGKESRQMYLEAGTQNSQDVQETGSLSKSKSEPKPASASKSETETMQAAGAENPLSTAEEAVCFVYVCGAVKHPGVFEMPAGSRVYEALALAGGLRKDAYDKDINQAKLVEDGQMIEVLTVKEHKEMTQQPQSTGETDARQDGDHRIDINTASKEQLMTLSGIGETKAASIISYRESSGGFSTPEELMNVNGIGEGVYARIQDKIKVIQ